MRPSGPREGSKAGDAEADARAEPAALVYRALADEDYAAAAGLAERHWGRLVSYQLHVIRAVADALPDAFLAENPRWASVRQYLSVVMMGPVLRPAGYPRRTHRTASTAADVLTMLTEGSVEARANGNFTEAGELAAKVLRQLDSAPDVGTEPASPLLPALLYQAGLSLELSARENDALAAFQRAYANATAEGDIRTAANASAELAWCHALAGRAEASDQWSRRHLAVSSAHPGIRMLRSTVHLARAYRLHDGLRFAEAAAELRRAAGDGIADHAPVAAALQVLFDAYAERGNTWDLVGRLDSAAAAAPAPTAGPGLAHHLLDGTRAVVLLFGAQPERARAVLDAVVEAGGSRLARARRAAVCYNLGDFIEAEHDADHVMQETRVWPRALVKALAIKSGCARRRGDPSAAADLFRQCARVAIENGLLLSLAVLPREDFLDLLGLAFPDGRPPELDAVAQCSPIFAPPVNELVRLTVQERRVLAELATGRTLVQVAARLHLSENTAKVHTRSIYRKLEVNSRQQAIAEAARRGLIEPERG